MHTPTPWQINDHHAKFDTINIVADGPILIATLSTNKNRCSAAELGHAFDNALHIIRCVNAHAALVAALESLIENCALGEYESQRQGKPRRTEAIAQAHHALALAKEGESHAHHEHQESR
jgi:hypothetical protein